MVHLRYSPVLPGDKSMKVRSFLGALALAMAIVNLSFLVGPVRLHEYVPCVSGVSFVTLLCVVTLVCVVTTRQR
ncbi:MAG: hypothetical protein RIQ41_333 [Candidatus Parcubacteria bacterium]|jgi:hypothetical protein